jgi:hypothetical protein
MLKLKATPRAAGASHTANVDGNLLKEGFKATRPAFISALVFSFFINCLAFVGSSSP